MISRSNIFLVFIIATIFIASLASSILPTTRKVIASYSEGKSIDTMKFNYHEFETDGNIDANYFRATLDHEMIHSFKSMNIIDQDVPTASAMGYYREWNLSGKLRDKEKNNQFLKGKTSVDVRKDIMEIIIKYRSSNVDTETIESYRDGARLAGLIASIFEDDDSSAMIYVLAVSMGLEHQFAMRVIENKELSKVIFGFRHGQYFAIDSNALNKDLEKLDPNLKENAIRYIKAVSNSYKIGLVEIRDVNIEGVP